MADFIHTPYAPESVTGEFGWLWCPDAPGGHEWVLIHTIDDGELIADMIGQMETDGTREAVAAEELAGLPYMGLARPAATPGEVDRLEVTVRYPGGLLATHSFGDTARAELVEAAMREVMSLAGRCAALDVLAERQRQVCEEGFSPAHDDRHIRGELGAVAACYAVPSRDRIFAVESLWPATWDRDWWKPTGAHDDLTARRRDLVKAGALILAEIERLDRQAAKEGRNDGRF